MSTYFHARDLLQSTPVSTISGNVSTKKKLIARLQLCTWEVQMQHLELSRGQQNATQSNQTTNSVTYPKDGITKPHPYTQVVHNDIAFTYFCSNQLLLRTKGVHFAASPNCRSLVIVASKEEEQIGPTTLPSLCITNNKTINQHPINFLQKLRH